MSPALRRSRRARKPSTYNVGDMIEIKRRARSYTGRLVYRLTEGESPNPLWLVTFDSGNVKDEEIYEKHFGKILRKGRTREGSSGDKPKRRSGGRSSAPTGGGRTVKAGHDDRSHSSGSDHDAGQQDDMIDDQDVGDGKKFGTSDGSRRNNRGGGNVSGNASGGSSDKGGSSPSAVSDSSGNNGNGENGSALPPLPQSQPEPQRPSRSSGKVSAREQRSLRRQAKIDEAAVMDRRKRSSSSVAGSIGDDSKRPRNGKDSGEEVVKVKLNTGTLYLYRGLNRRAVFVRRY